MPHDDTPELRPTQFPFSQPMAHPDCPCSILCLAPAAQLLTRQKGIATGGWGRKRDKLDARLCLGVCPIDQGGLHAYSYCCRLARPPTHSHTSTGPGICLSARVPTRGLMPPFSACLAAWLPAWGHHQQDPRALPAPATSHQASRASKI